MGDLRAELLVGRGPGGVLDLNTEFKRQRKSGTCNMPATHIFSQEIREAACNMPHQFFDTTKTFSLYCICLVFSPVFMSLIPSRHLLR